MRARAHEEEVSGAVSHVRVHWLGEVPYADTHALQESLVERRLRDEIGDTLLLLEHRAVLTLGRAAKADNVLLSREALAARGVDLFETGRGGDVTYHGPGQLVGYPIVKLSPDKQDVRKYVASLEQTMIDVAGSYGLSAGRVDGLNGAWVENRKIGAVGVRISRWVTMHGFALNVTTNLDHFSLIVPCGIRDRGVTSLSHELGRTVAMTEARERVVRAFTTFYGATHELFEGPPLG
jgi:lipoyl(octanoyl) transferase